MKKALLLGAGFSYDIGMPLAKDFTKIFFEELRPEKLKSVFERLKNNEPYGKEHPIDRETIDILYDLYLEYYHQPNANYEEFLKAIQTYTKKHSREEQRSCDYVFGFFHSIITDIFLSHQARVSLLFNSLKSFYKDIQNLIPEDDSLWVFSLGIPFSSSCARSAARARASTPRARAASCRSGARATAASSRAGTHS